MVAQAARRTGAVPSMRPRPVAWLIRSLKIATVAVGVTAASIGGYWGFLQYEGNLHPVADGLLYRSAQLSGAELASAARQYGIKSVLNLRGPNAGSRWYDDELAESRALGLVHYDYSLSAKRFVTGKQIADILDILRQAPKPLLVHCKAGADRAGLVAALYRYAVAGASAADADQELSLLYGHFPYLTSRSGAMDDSFWAFVQGARPATAE
jgi:protein tyrosine/serine phosphatase